MDLEAAANLGEALSGLAIMFTLLFGIRQVMEVNRNRRYEISETIAQSVYQDVVTTKRKKFMKKIGRQNLEETLFKNS